MTEARNDRMGGVAPLSRRNFLQLAAMAGLVPRAFAGVGRAEDVPVVKTALGALRGESSAEGVRVFRGVPFAQPPTGELRFRAPVAPKAWTGVRDATRFGAAAMQPNEPSVAQSEDCLYLNVWAPPSGGGPHPVFVWIHGGGYTGGQATAPIFDGSLFAHEGIVLVTVAYRLGVFGFMDLEPLLGAGYADSANNAIRDLTASLRWVHENIAAFGGDPARVTVGGESAGAKATAALMAVPEARALFRSAISESGGGERVLTEAEAGKVAQSFGELWRGEHALATAGFEDLRTGDARALIEVQQRVIARSEIHFPFRPQVSARRSALLAQRPVDLVRAGSAKGQRLLIGTNRDESALFLGPRPAADPTQRDLGNLSLARFDEVFARYSALYPEMPEWQQRVRAVTAEEYWVPSVRLADAHTEAGGEAWMYRLDYAETTGRMAGEAYHSEDIGFVWDKLGKTEAADPEAVRLAQAMHAAWCAFIRGEAPAGPGLPAWPEYRAASRPTMILNVESRVEQRPFESELRVWDGVL